MGALFVACSVQPMYNVDDTITGGDTVEEAFRVYSGSKRVFSERGFNLRKFLTNSSTFQEEIDHQESQDPHHPPLEYEPTYSETTLRVSQPSTMEEHKVLGVPWNPGPDQFMFRANDLARVTAHLPQTKRNLVSVIGRFYDPLGYLAPVVIRYKILLQKLCQSKADWDDAIPQELIEEWRDLISDINNAPTMSLPRSYHYDVIEPLLSATLCRFCDASEKAYMYAAVVYLRLNTESQCLVKFVTAKTRVAPLQTQTIPRMELLSALLLSKLVVSVFNSLQHEMASVNLQCYTDSQVAMLDPWHGKRLETDHLWRRGPECLRLDTPLPSDVDSMPMPELCLQELKMSSKLSHNLLAVKKKPTIGDLMLCSDFSSLRRMLRVTAYMYVLRAVTHFKAKKKSSLTSVTLTYMNCEIATAETLWISHTQKDLVTQKDFKTLQIQLGLFLDEKGLWRCGGRLQSADLPFAAKHPVLLSRSHPYTALVVCDAHQRVFHNGVKETPRFEVGTGL